MWWPPASVNATPVAKAVQEWITAVGDKRGVRWMVTVNATPNGLLSVGPQQLRRRPNGSLCILPVSWGGSYRTTKNTRRGDRSRCNQRPLEEGDAMLFSYRIPGTKEDELDHTAFLTQRGRGGD